MICSRSTGYILALLIALCACTPPAHAQILQGDWVDDTQAAIDKHRKADLTVIVLDEEDRAIQGAKVSFVQTRHDFVLGLTLPTDRKPPADFKTLPVYRCFNAIALDRYTDWSKELELDTQTQADRLAAWQLAIDPIRTAFGPVISAEPARNDDRLSLLEPADLRDAVLARMDLAAIYDPSPDTYDLYADLLGQDMLGRKLGPGMLHRLFDRAHAKRPDAKLGLRVRDAVTRQRGRDLVQLAQRYEIRQLPFDQITIDQTFTGTLQPLPLKRLFDSTLGSLRKPVTLASVEIAGPTPLAAAINLETVLRLAFAQPNLQGIYLAGLTEEQALEDNAALIDNTGNPTAAGQALDQLFTKLWHSNETATTDERGNATTRLFTGWYTLTATLPDGSEINTDIYLPKADKPTLMVLQKTKAE